MQYSLRTVQSVLILMGLVVSLASCREEPVLRDAGPDSGPVVMEDGGRDAGGEDAGTPCEGPPGLYADPGCEVLDVGVRPYVTRFSLWADGATKERYIYLPEGETIDTSDPDNWIFPVGTRLYKTFLRDGVRLETRLIEKTDPGAGIAAWEMRAFAWTEAQNAVVDVTNEPAAVREDVLGTTHDIPSGADCVRCHGGRDVINGFSAIMLNHDMAGVTLATLNDETRLSEPISAALASVPGDATAVDALGYLHANCGHCHREISSDAAASSTGMWLWVRTGRATVESTDAYTTSVGEVANYFNPATPNTICRIHPGSPDTSTMVARMETRGGSGQMPPLATEDVHAAGVDQVRAWITGVTGDGTDCVP